MWGFATLVAGCGGNSTPHPGTPVITLGDPSGDFASYIVVIDSIVLTEANGTLAEVLATGLADAVLLYNMGTASMRQADAMVAGKLPLEASGGITLDTIAEIAATGVDYASSGWITHSAPNLDVALDIEM